MLLVLVSGSAEVGGAERCLLDMTASLRQARPDWDLHVVTPAEGPLAETARAMGVGVDAVPFGPTLSRIGEATANRADLPRTLVRVACAAGPVADYARRLRLRLRDLAPTIVHTHGVKAHLAAAWTKPVDARVVWHLHDYLGPRGTSTALLRRSLGRCAAVIANSRSVAIDAHRALGGRVPVVTVLNAVDLRRYCPTGPTVDLDRLGEAPPPRPGTLRVDLLATFGRWKGHATFIDACAQLMPHLPMYAYIIGAPLYTTDGSQYSLEELKARARAAGIGSRLTFTGYAPHSEQALRALDIVVHASTDPEPFGLVIAEAMACGRAVIVADAGGSREIIEPGVDALTHIPGDATSLAARIRDLIADPARRASLAAAAREAALTRFDRMRLASDLAPVYEHALTAGARS
ncbi:MAG: glycosyltransferase family 4 protein [Acidimicrobiia bacterium]|nr:glycosyltransferase family 4 protein [Acidimicrobiia bacterium]